jgi:GNAT superfamily N-acetyltransferase
MRPKGVSIAPARPEEFATAREFWLAMRRETDMPDADLAFDWKARFIAYCERRYHARELQWFFARDGSQPVASAAGFLLEDYPREICINRKVGYVAGVYVLPAWRRRGLARAVTQAAVDWLRSLGCAAVRLHAADEARPIYASMGFVPTNEMILETI